MPGEQGSAPPQCRLLVSERSYGEAPSTDRHPFVQVVLPERGRLAMQIAGERGYAGETRFALVPSGVEHRYWGEGPNRFLVLDLATSLIDDAQRDLEQPAALLTDVFPVMGERFAALGALLRAELARGGLAEPLIAESLGLYAATLLCQPAAAPVSASSLGERRLAVRTRDYLDASYLEPVTLGQIAAAAGASVSHTQRSFRAHFRITIVDYLNARRLERARELLRVTDLSIAEVALASGFNDQSYFTRRFSHEVGLPPSRYRSSIRAGSDKPSR